MNNRNKTVVRTQKIFINNISSDAITWMIFHQIFDLVQRDCIAASNRCISLCNIYTSHSVSFGEDSSSQWLDTVYPGRSIRNALYQECVSKSVISYAKNLNYISEEINSKYFKGKNSYLWKIKTGQGNPPMTYTTSLPVPIDGGGMSLKKDLSPNGKHYIIEFPFLSVKGKKAVEEKFGIKLKTGRISVGTVARDKHIQSILDNIIAGNYKLCTSKLQRAESRGRKKEYTILLAYESPVKEHVSLDPDRIMGVDLGVKIPAMCAFNFDERIRYALGGTWIIKENMRQERKNRKKQHDITFNMRDGHGRTVKLDGYDGKGHIINHRNSTYNHALAKRIVENAVKHHCGTIHIEDLSGITGGHQSGFLKAWTYYDLQQKIIDKANATGITVVKVNPFHTSQICSCCGHYEPGQRPAQAAFICKNPDCKHFGAEVNADYNAARNISLYDPASVKRKAA